MSIKLNMEEKKKLEKIAIADIDKAVQKIRSLKSEAESNFEDKPSKEIKDLFEAWIKADTLEKKIKKQLEAKGYAVSSAYGDSEAKLRVSSYNNENKELAVLRKTWNDKIDKAEGMKRSIIISLYTTGQEAQQFLMDLEQKLNALLK